MSERAGGGAAARSARRVITATTHLAAVPYVPEIRLQQAEDPFTVWEHLEQEAGQGSLPPPFWAFPWAGGQALARYLLDHPAVVAGQRVLDVASGSGLVAIAAARSGARPVLAADVDEIAVRAISVNAAANGVRVTPVLADLLDGDGDGADVVLCADAFYEQDLAGRILAFLRPRPRARRPGARRGPRAGPSCAPPGFAPVATLRDPGHDRAGGHDRETGHRVRGHRWSARQVAAMAPPARSCRHGGPLPLPALLSQALVAFTIESDNEAEHRMQHRTTSHSSPGDRGPWLVSMAMWFNCMRFVTEEPMPVSELERLARTGTNLDGMRRWGYVFLESASGDPRRKPRPADLTIRATGKGQRAQQVWRPLPADIEDRWRERFGAAQIGRAARLAVGPGRARRGGAAGLPADPRLRPVQRQEDCVPAPRPTPVAADPGLPLPVLLARVLLGYAIRFEQRSRISLAICANVLRVLTGAGVRVRDLPAASGVSKESIAMAMGILTKADLAAVGPDPGGGRWKVARLTPRGQEAQWAYADWTAAVDQKSAERFGADAVARLRAALEPLAGDGARR